MPPSFTPKFSPSDLGKLHPILQSATFYRIWFLGGGFVVLLWALHNLHALGWAAQPLYMICLFAFAFTTGENICARCIHFDSWHCWGVGKGAAKLFPQQDNPLPQTTRHQHFILLALTVGATLLGLFAGGLLPGAVGILWVAGASMTVFPGDRPFSWIAGRRKTAELLAKMRNRPEAAKPAPAVDVPPPGSPRTTRDGRCPNCGDMMEPEVQFCPQCGQEVAQVASKSTASAKSPKGATQKPGDASPERVNLEQGIPMIPVSEQEIPTPKKPPAPTGPAATAVVRPPLPTTPSDIPTNESK